MTPKARSKPGQKRGGQPKGGFQKGHDPRRNVTTPGPGRPPDEFKQLCQRLASRNRTVNVVAKILSDEEHPMFMAALKWATEHGYGKAMQPIEHSGAEGGAITVRVVRDT